MTVLVHLKIAISLLMGKKLNKASAKTKMSMCYEMVIVRGDSKNVSWFPETALHPIQNAMVLHDV